MTEDFSNASKHYMYGSKASLETHSSGLLSEETLTPKRTRVCMSLEHFDLHEDAQIGRMCSILETCSGERTGNRFRRRTLNLPKRD